MVGPFINNPYALFGDYSPTVMVCPLVAMTNVSAIFTVIPNLCLQLEYVVTPLQGIKSFTSIGKTVLNSAAGCNDAKCRYVAHSIPVSLSLLAQFYIPSIYDSSVVKTVCSGVDMAIVCLGTGTVCMYCACITLLFAMMVCNLAM